MGILYLLKLARKRRRLVQPETVQFVVTSVTDEPTYDAESDMLYGALSIPPKTSIRFTYPGTVDSYTATLDILKDDVYLESIGMHETDATVYDIITPGVYTYSLVVTVTEGAGQLTSPSFPLTSSHWVEAYPPTFTLVSDPTWELAGGDYGTFTFPDKLDIVTAYDGDDIDEWYVKWVTDRPYSPTIANIKDIYEPGVTTTLITSMSGRYSFQPLVYIKYHSATEFEEYTVSGVIPSIVTNPSKPILTINTPAVVDALLPKITFASLDDQGVTYTDNGSTGTLTSVDYKVDISFGVESWTVELQQSAATEWTVPVTTDGNFTMTYNLTVTNAKGASPPADTVSQSIYYYLPGDPRNYAPVRLDMNYATETEFHAVQDWANTFYGDPSRYTFNGLPTRPILFTDLPVRLASLPDTVPDFVAYMTFSSSSNYGQQIRVLGDGAAPNIAIKVTNNFTDRSGNDLGVPWVADKAYTVVCLNKSGDLVQYRMYDIGAQLLCDVTLPEASAYSGVGIKLQINADFTTYNAGCMEGTLSNQECDNLAAFLSEDYASYSTVAGTTSGPVAISSVETTAGEAEPRYAISGAIDGSTAEWKVNAYRSADPSGTITLGFTGVEVVTSIRLYGIWRAHNDSNHLIGELAVRANPDGPNKTLWSNLGSPWTTYDYTITGINPPDITAQWKLAYIDIPIPIGFPATSLALDCVRMNSNVDGNFPIFEVEITGSPL